MFHQIEPMESSSSDDQNFYLDLKRMEVLMNKKKTQEPKKKEESEIDEISNLS